MPPEVETRAPSCTCVTLAPGGPGGFGEMQSVPPGRAARPQAVSSVAPVPTGTRAPYVLAWEQASHPGDERHSAKPSGAPQYATAFAARLRFAPSPTDFLHIGRADTALSDWLF